MWTEAKSLSLQVKRSRWGKQPKAQKETAISLERSSTKPTRRERQGRWWSWAGGTCRSTPYGRARRWRHLPRKSLQHYAVWLLCSAGGSQVSLQIPLFLVFPSFYLSCRLKDTKSQFSHVHVWQGSSSTRPHITSVRVFHRVWFFC